MRIALWVVVVAAHLLVIWMFMASRRAAREEELVFAAISLLPEPSQPRSIPPARGGPTQHVRTTHAPPERGPQPVEEETTPAVTAAPDWRAQVEVVAESSAQRSIHSDRARRLRFTC